MDITLKSADGKICEATVSTYGGTLGQPKDILMVSLSERLPVGQYTAIVGGDQYEVALSYSPHGGNEFALAFLDGCDIPSILKSAGVKA